MSLFVNMMQQGKEKQEERAQNEVACLFINLREYSAPAQEETAGLAQVICFLLKSGSY
jgi:hypothetical protein